jgi:hypothetical protein
VSDGISILTNFRGSLVADRSIMALHAMTQRPGGDDIDDRNLFHDAAERV